MLSLQRMLNAGVVIKEHSKYVFYRNDTRILLGINAYIAQHNINYFTELYARYRYRHVWRVMYPFYS